MFFGGVFYQQNAAEMPSCLHIYMYGCCYGTLNTKDVSN